MVGSLLSTEGYLEPADDAKKQLKDSAGEVLDKAIAALEAVDEADWKTDNLHETLNKALVEEGGYKPRLAFGPVRVAMREPAAVRVHGDRRQAGFPRSPEGPARAPVS